MIKDYPCISTVDMIMSVQNSIHTNIHTQVSPLKYLGTLLSFFVGRGEVIKEGGYLRPGRPLALSEPERM